MKSFKEFINESLDLTQWKEMKLDTRGEKEVKEVVEQTLLSEDLSVIRESDKLYSIFEQVSSSQDYEVILEINGNVLYLYSTPVEFIKWDRTGSNVHDVIETYYIVKSTELLKFR